MKNPTTAASDILRRIKLMTVSSASMIVNVNLGLQALHHLRDSRVWPLTLPSPVGRGNYDGDAGTHLILVLEQVGMLR